MICILKMLRKWQSAINFYYVSSNLIEFAIFKAMLTSLQCHLSKSLQITHFVGPDVCESTCGQTDRESASGHTDLESASGHTDLESASGHTALHV